MTSLHLGVIELPYVEAPPAPTKRGKAKPRTAGTLTTGDVASFLEAKYHVMEIFYEQHQDEIGADIAESLAGTLESTLMGAPLAADPFAQAAEDIGKKFKTFLEKKEMDSLGYPGVPTKASLEGVSPRFKSGKGPVRPSFVSSALYESSFKAWVD